MFICERCFPCLLYDLSTHMTYGHLSPKQSSIIDALNWPKPNLTVREIIINIGKSDVSNAASALQHTWFVTQFLSNRSRLKVDLIDMDRIWRKLVLIKLHYRDSCWHARTSLDALAAFLINLLSTESCIFFCIDNLSILSARYLLNNVFPSAVLVRTSWLYAEPQGFIERIY